MHPPLTSPRLLRWLFLMVVVLGAYPLQAQKPVPDGGDRHPSDYRYPVLTWTQREPTYFLPNRDRQEFGVDLIRKLQSIVIPRIGFRNTTLTDAVEFLSQESRLLDPDPDPQSRGVNIFLRLPKPPPIADISVESIPGLPPSPAVPTSSEPATRITLTMERLPLLEALKSVALQTGMKVQVERYAISIVPLAYAIPALVTADYRVPPELLGLPTNVSDCFPQDQTSQGGEVTVVRINITPQFESKGVVFPLGASAVYLPRFQKLVVRNTQENLDKVVSVISSALKPAAPLPVTP